MGAGAKLAAAAVAGALLATAGHGHHHHQWAHLLSVGASSTGGDIALGRRMAAREYGWGGAQWDCLDSLWAGESGWRPNADTRVSGLDPAGAAVFAYGIPQARGHGQQSGGVTAPYPPAFAAANPPGLGGSSSARTQIKWGFGYIEATYGSPCAALSFKQAHGNQGY